MVVGSVVGVLQHLSARRSGGIAHAHHLVGEHVLDVVDIVIHGDEVPVDIRRRFRRRLLNQVGARSLALAGDPQFHTTRGVHQRVLIAVVDCMQRAHIGRAAAARRGHGSRAAAAATAHKANRRHCDSNPAKFHLILPELSMLLISDTHHAPSC